MSRARKLTGSGRDVFIGAVLEMLDEGVGLRDLNLRRVAKRAGCSHTNAYNYFVSYDELLWWSLRGALERMVTLAEPASEDLIDVYVRYALDHPAWYRLVWLDPLTEPPPAEVAEYLAVPARVFATWVATNLWRGDQGGGALDLATRVLHGYLHGELAAITTGRVAGRRDELVKRVREGTDILMNALMEGSS